MAATAISGPSVSVIRTSVREKLFDIFVSPRDVFDEIIASPPNLANWRVPTLLVCLIAIISLQTAGSNEQLAIAIRKLSEAGAISAAQAQALPGLWPLLSSLLIGVAAFGGTCWSAFVLWFIGRVFLKVRFPYVKALEVVGLTGIILLLGSIVTILLTVISGVPTARPALSLLANNMSPSRPFYQVLTTLDLFYIWNTTVIAIGLSRLGNVSFKEAFFWVFGYWIALRIVLIILQ